MSNHYHFCATRRQNGAGWTLTVEWTKTEYGHVYVTNSDNPYRRLSLRG